MESWLKFIRDLFPSAWRIIPFIVGIIAAYDALSSQFGLPVLSSFIPGLAGTMQWWGWLLVFQAVFLLALANYVRKLPTVAARLPDPVPVLEKVEAKALPHPDLKLDELVLRVNAFLNAEQAKLPKGEQSPVTMTTIGLELIDKINMHGLTVWARQKGRAIQHVSPQNLSRASFDWNPTALRIAHANGSSVLTDVQFVSAETDQYWPPFDKTLPTLR